MDDYGLNELCEKLNELCGEDFSVAFEGDDIGDAIVTLYNGDTEITEDTDFGVHERLMQIAKENGVKDMLD